MLSNRNAIVALTALAPLTWSTTYITTTTLLPPDAPLLTAALRALPAGLLLLALTRTLPRGQWWWRASVLGVLNVGAFFPLLFLGAYLLPGGVAATVGAVQPLVVLGVARLALGERAGAVRVLAALAGIGGVALLMLTPAARLDPLGLVAALAGAVVMAVGVALTKAWRPPVPPLTLTAWQLTAGGLFLVPFAAAEGLPAGGFDGASIAGYLWLGLPGTAVAYALWFRGIARLEASTVAFLGLLTAVSAAAIGWLALGESLSLGQLAGAAVVLAAVAVATHPATARRQPPGRRREARASAQVPRRSAV